MLLATTKVEDVDHFIEVFSTRAAEKRKTHGSKGAFVFRDPFDSDRVWGIFDWDEQGWQASCPTQTFARSWRQPG